MKLKYPRADQLKLLFADTDLLTYHIETEDTYADMLKDNHLFDFSYYPDKHPCFNNLSPSSVNDIKQQNKRVIGKFKDRLKGVSFEEFVGLRPKLYSIMYIEEKNIEVNEDGEEEEVDESSTSFKKIVKMEDKKTAKGVKKVVKKQH